MPDRLAELLQEVRVAAAGLDKDLEGVRGEGTAVFFDRDPECVGGICGGERSDGSVGELPFGVGVAVDECGQKAGQDGADDEP
ncbi:hypothetical protein [Rhodococcus wratislaviensis]|uniref:hypothetical protein n=1 Tax=Rhodococcus wratislaviensis TaxID=44752 RepID=UPI001788AE3D|nr:hypothetical protein [Rhodococcus wratislaviensis]